MVLGKQHHRDGPVSGVIIADGTGTERGGYVTADGYANAMLTLDAQGKQTVLLLAEPSGDTLLRLWNRNGEIVTGSLTMGVSGNPFFNEKQNGNLDFSAPMNNTWSSGYKTCFSDERSSFSIVVFENRADRLSFVMRERKMGYPAEKKMET